MKFIGRKQEIAMLQSASSSDEAELISVIGRRRVGKTFLIKHVFSKQISFELTGIQHASLKEQLLNFAFQLGVSAGASLRPASPDSWLEAFQQLIGILEQNKQKQKQVLFFDELPWLASKRSGFLKAFSFFWNSWAVNQPIVIVICGSAASWMIQKVVNNKGGLHNRITRNIHLKPFSLTETEAFFMSRNISLNRQQIAHLYMALGGVPHYLKEIKPGKSAAQNIDAICFSEQGLLKNEFSRLYPALFEKSENHIKIIRALANKRSGLERAEILEKTKMPNGGGLTRILEELEQSGFISSYYPFGKKKRGMVYRLIDEYSLFYLRFIEKQRSDGAGTWQKLSQGQKYKTWTGYAFENLVLTHIKEVKRAIGIEAVYSENSSLYIKADEQSSGVQIDLIIDRNDGVINLCEIKFHEAPLNLTKKEAEVLRNRLIVFKSITSTRKQVFLTLISASGLSENKHSIGLVDEVLDLDALFG